MPDDKRPERRREDVPRTSRIHRRGAPQEPEPRDIDLFREAELLDTPRVPPAEKAPPTAPAPKQRMTPVSFTDDEPRAPRQAPPPKQRMQPVSFTDDGPRKSTQPVDELEALLQSADGGQPPPPDEPPKKKGFSFGAPKGKKDKDKPEKPFKQPRPKEKRRLRDIFTVKRVILALVSLFFVGVVGAGFFFVHTTRNDDLWLDLATIPYRTETQLYYTDSGGQQQVYFTIPCTQNKEYVASADIPQILRDAFVAIEDQKFYDHFGVDVKRTVFAVLNEGVHAVTGSYIGGDSGRKQGASTITQQLIKNLTRDDDDSNMAGYLRKLREICRAIRLDALYDKNEILDAYLNTISFTGNTAGVQAEAKKLWNKTVDQLSLAECASLAAITRNPARYNPATNPEDHTERRDYVLSLMLEEGYITQAQHDEAVATPVWTAGNPEPKLDTYVTDYFTDTVMDSVVTQLAAKFNLTRREASNLLYNGGLRIYTTVNPELQASMEKVMENATYHPQPAVTVEGPEGEERVTPQAAMVSLDYGGGIAAVVGGLGEKEISRGFNRATQAVRQVGSTMKPIAPYVTALEDNKINWSTPFMDSAVLEVKDKETGQVSDWPRNVTNRYTEKDILVRDALAQSVNTVAVRVGQTAGVRRMYNFVTKDLGISTFTKDDRDLGPLVLGSSTYGITPVEMAMAYAMFGNGGYAVTPHSYTKITSGTGTVIYEPKVATTRVISGETAFIMNRLLRTVLTDGTAAGWSVGGEMDSVGKTGTTSDNRDHWFVGLTPYYVTASWYGYDENLPLSVDNRNHPPTLSWRTVMQQGQQGLAYKEFPGAAGVEQQQYCTVSGARAGGSCPAATGWYKTGAGPKGACPVHGA